MTKLVGNLNIKATEDLLKKRFTSYGTVKQVNIPSNRETSHTCIFVFLEMSSDKEELSAIEDLDSIKWIDSYELRQSSESNVS